VIRFCFIVLLINIVSFFVKGRLLLRIKNKTLHLNVITTAYERMPLWILKQVNFIEPIA